MWKKERMTDAQLEKHLKPRPSRKDVIAALVGLGSGEAVEVPEADINYSTVRNHVFYANEELQKTNKLRRLTTRRVRELGERRTRIECVPIVTREMVEVGTKEDLGV